MSVISRLQLAVLVSSCSKSDNAPDYLDVTAEKAKPISLSRSERIIVNGEINVALSFFQKFVESKPETNAICSPFSLSNVLALLSNGVCDEARSEIYSFYGIDAMESNGLNELHARLLRELKVIDSRVTLTSANAVNLCPMYDFYSEFKERVVSDLNVEVLNYNIYQPSGIRQLNQWCSGKTNGLINNILSENGTYSGFAVASADYFKAKWTMPFDGKDTENKDFTCENGDVKRVPTMVGSKQISAYTDNKISLIQIPYGNQAFRFSIVLPGGFHNDNGVTIADAVNELSFEKWKKMNDEKLNNSCIINLPKFSITTSGNIEELLGAIGFEELFKEGAVSKISPNLPDDEKNVSYINQAVKITVEENGTTATSVTISGGSLSNFVVPEKIFINRPFLFIIDETSTGAIIYAGVVRAL